MRKIALLAVTILMVYPAPAVAEGLGDLIDFGKSMADINAAMNEETKAFDRVKSAVENGRLKKGALKADIRSRYGEPVIENDDSATGRQKWVYKPSSSSFFDGIRIYLYFDDTGAVDEIKVLS